MESLPTGRDPAPASEPIKLEPTFRVRFRGFTVFLLCCALMTAAFAVSAVWMHADGGWFGIKTGDTAEGESTDGDGAQTDNGTEATIPGTEHPEEPTPIPEGATPVVPMDLAYLSLGDSYVHNETAYDPITALLREKKLDIDVSGEAPRVLILHTHTTESFLPEGTAYVDGDPGGATYGKDSTQSVIGVGEILCQVLNERGIPTLHCTVMHDESGLQGSYARSAETVRAYLKEYPSIVCVIDLHRDAVMNSKGEYIRSLADGCDQPTAQVLTVVGTDGNGTPCPGWENNLALALQLREALNCDGRALCRPVSLRNASYNQELAPFSLLLEIGTGGNSPEEAARAAILVGEALAELLLGD